MSRMSNTSLAPLNLAIKYPLKDINKGGEEVITISYFRNEKI